MENRIKEILALICELELDQMTEDASQKTIEKWDSLNHMNLIVSIENEFDIVFEDDEILSLTSLAALIDSVKAKLNN
jgi:acyl carrier protein